MTERSRNNAQPPPPPPPPPTESSESTANELASLKADVARLELELVRSKAAEVEKGEQIKAHKAEVEALLQQVADARGEAAALRAKLEATAAAGDPVPLSGEAREMVNLF